MLGRSQLLITNYTHLSLHAHLPQYNFLKIFLKNYKDLLEVSGDYCTQNTGDLYFTDF